MKMRSHRIDTPSTQDDTSRRLFAERPVCWAKRLAAVLSSTAGLLTFSVHGAATVSAQNYPIIPTTAVATSPTAVAAGTSTTLAKAPEAASIVEVILAGFVPGERVVVSVGATSMPFIVGADGVLRGSVVVPESSADGMAVSIVGASRHITGIVRGTVVVVLAERAVAPSPAEVAPASKDQPAFTGQESIGLGAAGTALIGVGGLLARAARRRRTLATDPPMNPIQGVVRVKPGA